MLQEVAIPAHQHLVFSLQLLQTYHQCTQQQLLTSNYEVHDLPSPEQESVSDHIDQNPTVTVVLLAHIEFLEAENERLKVAELSRPKQHLRIKDIKHDNKLVQLFTSFVSYTMFSTFWDLL